MIKDKFYVEQNGRDARPILSSQGCVILRGQLELVSHSRLTPCKVSPKEQAVSHTWGPAASKTSVAIAGKDWIERWKVNRYLRPQSALNQSQWDEEMLRSKMDAMTSPSAPQSDLVCDDAISHWVQELIRIISWRSKKKERQIKFHSLSVPVAEAANYHLLPSWMRLQIICVCNAGCSHYAALPSPCLAAGSWQWRTVPWPAGRLMPSKWLISGCSSEELAVCCFALACWLGSVLVKAVGSLAAFASCQPAVACSLQPRRAPGRPGKKGWGKWGLASGLQPCWEHKGKETGKERENALSSSYSGVYWVLSLQLEEMRKRQRYQRRSQRE